MNFISLDIWVTYYCFKTSHVTILFSNFIFIVGEGVEYFATLVVWLIKLVLTYNTNKNIYVSLTDVIISLKSVNYRSTKKPWTKICIVIMINLGFLYCFCKYQFTNFLLGCVWLITIYLNSCIVSRNKNIVPTPLPLITL